MCTDMSTYRHIHIDRFESMYVIFAYRSKYVKGTNMNKQKMNVNIHIYIYVYTYAHIYEAYIAPKVSVCTGTLQTHGLEMPKTSARSLALLHHEVVFSCAVRTECSVWESATAPVFARRPAQTY